MIFFFLNEFFPPFFVDKVVNCFVFCFFLFLLGKVRYGPIQEGGKAKGGDTN